MGSDGLFDNLFEKDIIECVKPNINPKKNELKINDLKKVSDCLSVKAEVMGYDPNYESPFTIEARTHGKNYPGGKADDITVIVA